MANDLSGSPYLHSVLGTIFFEASVKVMLAILIQRRIKNGPATLPG